MTDVALVFLVGFVVVSILFVIAMHGIETQKDLKEQFRMAYHDEAAKGKHWYDEHTKLQRKLTKCLAGEAMVLPTGVNPMDIFRRAQAMGADVEIIDMSDLDQARHLGHITWPGDLTGEQ